MVPQEKERRDQMQYYKTVTTDQYGRFTLKNLDPGEYKCSPGKMWRRARIWIQSS